MQDKLHYIGDLFDPKTHSTALRGDKSLWKEMQEKSMGITIDNIKSDEDCKNYLYLLFNEITGHKLKDGEKIYIKRYDPGHGMSSGMVVMSWWIMVGIPILIKRFKEKASPSKDEDDYFRELNGKRHKMIKEKV